MPEGHTIRRIARLHREALAGRPVRVTSPQGRFAGGAALLDGRVLTDVEAAGKHLFYRFRGHGGAEGAAGGRGPSHDQILHVHLGLIGRLQLFGDPPPDPSPGTRLAMSANGATMHLSGPMTCRLIDPGTADEIRAALGPDPLANGTLEEFAAALRRRSLPIGAALLDQRVVAGIGNVYRAEVLFLSRIDPDRPARSLAGEEVACLWETVVRLMALGERLGSIVTVDGADPAGDERDRVHVYHRAGLPCRRCGTELRAWPVGGRAITACPRCQPSAASRETGQ